MINVHKYYEYMEQNNILLLFKGAMNVELISSILQIAEAKLEKYNEQPKVKKKLFNVLVECLQNVYLHLDKTKQLNVSTEDDSAILIIGKVEDGYKIVTGNYIENLNAQKLRDNLDYLMELDDEDLKEKYREVLSNQGFSEKGGAGLGLIDIIRKSGRQVDYKIKELNDQFSFFSMQVTIQNNK